MTPFEMIVREHGPTVLRVCRAILTAHDAEDAWSETFLSALQAYPSLGADANVEAWLVTIAKRKAIDVIRTRSRTPVPVGEVPDGASELGIPDDERGEVWSLIGALPDKQRKCVAYHYIVGLPHSEVAAIVGGTTDAARRAAADGVAALRRAYSTIPGGTP
jgi:RNA polymerase sigma factor (sigma-70 family)